MSLRTPILTTVPDIAAEAAALRVKPAAMAKTTAIFMCIQSFRNWRNRYCFCCGATLIRGLQQGQPAEGTRQVQDQIENALTAIRFGSDGLVPAIAQQHDTGEILMLAWMNRDAVRASLAEGRVCYWSRSRARLGRKGGPSG